MFLSYANFRSAKFDSIADFRSAWFKSLVGFQFAEFNATVAFSEAKFSSHASFKYSELNSPGEFWFVLFGETCDFSNTVFRSRAKFKYTEFNEHANFEDSSFDSLLSFSQSKFASSSSFQNARFSSSVDFRNVDFGRKADFSSAIFGGRVNFYNANLPDSLDFSNVTTIHKDVDFRSARKSNGTCYINLFNTDISKVKLRYGLFRLWFPEKISISPLDTIRITLQDKCTVYEQLLANFKENGFDDSYQQLDIEFKQLLYRANGQWYLDLLDRWWWNYGYTKSFVFIWIIGLFIGFTMINARIIGQLVEETYSISSLEMLHKHNKLTTWWEKWCFALTYTSIVFFGIHFNAEGIKRYNGLIYYIFAIYASGVLCLGYLANFVFAK